MRAGLGVAIVVVLLAIAAFAFGWIDIDQTRQTRLPEVHVEGGQAPAFDINTADVKVGSTSTTVELPKVEVNTTERKIELPTVEVEKAKSN